MNKFLFYLIKRFTYLVIVLVGLSVFIFLLVRLMPGDPARLALGPEATKAQVENLRHELGLDEPLYYQYYVFLRRLFQGKLGLSLMSKRDVANDLIQRLPATFELVLLSLTAAVLFGVPLGVVTALRKDGIIDQVSRIFAFAGVSFPRFWLGIMFQLMFAYSLGLFPVTGRIGGTPPEHISGIYLLDSLLTMDFSAFVDSLSHLCLPVIVLSLSPIAQITRLVRASMIEQLGKEYTTVFRTAGMPENLNVYKYMLKNAFTDSLTIIGLLFGSLLGRCFVVEKVFAWPGMASYGINSVIAKDINAIVGVTLIIGITYGVVNFVVDSLYGYLDPRIRLRR